MLQRAEKMTHIRHLAKINYKVDVIRLFLINVEKQFLILNTLCDNIFPQVSILGVDIDYYYHMSIDEIHLIN